MEDSYRAVEEILVLIWLFCDDVAWFKARTAHGEGAD
jgi:hypothetical protein